MYQHSLSHFADGTTRIVAICRMCKHYHVFILNTPDYLNWQRGTPIQDVWPDMVLDKRELLISGTCGTCFNKNVSDEP